MADCTRVGAGVGGGTDVAGTCHGKKRPAKEDPDGDQPLAKRLSRLHLGVCLALQFFYNHQNQNHYSHHLTDSLKQKVPNQNDTAPRPSQSRPTDMMMLDDTEHTVYIHDLDRELAEAESSEDHSIFLSAIGEKLAVIPKSLVAQSKPNCQALVLYQEPTSLSVPRDKDNAGKALAETRERARSLYNASSVDESQQAHLSHRPCEQDGMDVDDTTQ